MRFTGVSGNTRTSAVSCVLVLWLAGCTGTPNEEAPGDPVPLTLSCLSPCATTIEEGRRWEASVAVNPSDPDHIVASSQDLSRRPGLLARHWPRAHVSFDGGLSWSSHQMPGGDEGDPDHPLATFNAMDDSVVTFLPDGTVLWSAIARTRLPPDSAPGETPQSLVVYRSTDGGRSYPSVTIVAEGEGLHGPNDELVPAAGAFTPQAASASGHDKQWMTTDENGTALLVWSWNLRAHPDCQGLASQAECTWLSWSRSDDGGLGWTEPAFIDWSLVASGAAPLMDPRGAWMVAYRDTGASKLRIATSHDEGTSWQGTVLDDTTKFPMVTRTTNAWFVVYPQSPYDDRDRAQNVTLRWSTDQGTTWSEGLLVDAPPGERRTIPAIASVGPANGDAIVLMYWYPLGEAAQLRARAWSPAAGLSEVLVLANTTGDVARTGDYMGLSAAPDGTVVAVWVEPDSDSFRVQFARLAIGEKQ